MSSQRGKLRPVKALDTATVWKVAVDAQKHERPERLLRPFCDGLQLSPGYQPRFSALDIELFRMQRRIALNQDVLSGQLLKLNQP